MTDYLTPDHRIILARITGGWVKWRLECAHAPDDPRFHFYCDHGIEPDQHVECIVRPWWDECGIELVEDTEGPIVTPIPVRAVPTGDGWVLAQTETAGDN